MGVGPLGVEVTFHVVTLVGVSAEEVALCLGDVGREVCATVGVEVVDGRSHGWAGDAARNSESDNAAPCGLARVELGSKLRVDHEVGKLGVAVEGLLDAVEEPSTDDASSAPDGGAVSEGSVAPPAAR